MKQEDIDAMKAASVKADEIFATAREGRDPADPVYYKTEVHFKDIPDDLVPAKNGKGDSMPQPKTMIMTRNSIGITPTTVQLILN